MPRSIFLVLLAIASYAAQAQVVPDRAYNGVGRPFPVTIKRPKGAKGPLTLGLFSAAVGLPLDTANVEVGKSDLQKVFPGLWTQKYQSVIYAQLVADRKPVGPALVLQPLLSPPLAKLKADGKTIEFVPETDQAYSGIRACVNQDVVLDTTLGELEFRMRPDAAPNTTWNFLELVKGGFFTDIIWHRVVARRPNGDPFVIQAGDPTGTGNGGPGYNFPLEDSSLPHDFGVISIARDTDPNTNGSQFFVCLSRAGTQHLDHRYAAFGELVRGADVVAKTAAVPVGKEDHPTNPPIIRRAYLVDAKPVGSVK